MRRLAVAAVLALAVASPVSAAANSITAGDGPYTFGQYVPTFDLVAAYSTNNSVKPGDGLWARVDCLDLTDGLGGLAQYQSLDSTTQQGGWYLGPTPSWESGPGACTLSLIRFRNGLSRTLATDSFEVAG